MITQILQDILSEKGYTFYSFQGPNDTCKGQVYDIVAPWCIVHSNHNGKNYVYISVAEPP